MMEQHTLRTWDSVKLKVIPDDKIFRRQVARIRLPKIWTVSNGLLQFLRLQNLSIPLDDWVVIKGKES